MKFMASCRLAALVLLAISIPGFTQSCAAIAPRAVTADLFNGLPWRSIGPAATGGRIADLAVSKVPGQPAEMYVGTTSGGVFKSVNEGVSRTPVFDHAGAMMSIGAIA